MAGASRCTGSFPRIEAAIAERIERLPEDRRSSLSAASVQGDDFTGELVAELTGRPLGEVFACLSGSLACQQSSAEVARVPAQSPSGPPSRTARLRRLQAKVCSIYRFTDHLFQKYLYDALDPIERVIWHAAMAAGLER